MTHSSCQPSGVVATVIAIICYEHVQSLKCGVTNSLSSPSTSATSVLQLELTVLVTWGYDLEPGVACVLPLFLSGLAAPLQMSSFPQL